MDTFRQLIEKTIRKLSMYPGTGGVQEYAEDRIALMIQDKFDELFETVDWPQFMQWFEVELDGVQGIPLTPLTDIKSIHHIKAVFAENNPIQLSYAANKTPYPSYVGNVPRFYTQANDVPERLIKVWPKESTGKLKIYAKVKPDEFTLNDVVPMDSLLLTSGAAYDFSSDDGHNPGQVQKFQTQFENRFNQLRSQINSMPIQLDPRIQDYPTDWFYERF